MGAWGHGPLETDDAADVIGAVRYVLDQGWEPLREDELDDAGLALATETAAIALSLLRGGIRVEPDDRDELVDAWGDDLPGVVVAALTADAAPERPGFPDERAVERWLREGHARYEVWMSAAAYGDDRAAAWHACTNTATLFTMARLAGVPDPELTRALAAAVGTLVGENDADALLRDVLATLAAGHAIDKHTVSRVADIPTQQGDDRRAAIVTTTYDLARGGIRHGLGRLSRLIDAVHDLAAVTRPHLDPLVRGRF